MKVVLFSCLVAVCVGIPVQDQNDRAYFRLLIDTLTESRVTDVKRGAKSIDNVNKLFNLIDSNNDGHIDREEYSTYYDRVGASVNLHLSKDLWAYAFDQAMKKAYVDLNDNDMLEPNGKPEIYWR